MYRKPEWVTHMEELQAALKGNEGSKSSCMSVLPSDLSLDSLDAAPYVNDGYVDAPSLDIINYRNVPPDQFYLNYSSASDSNSVSSERSVTSICSDPFPKSKKSNFVKSAMDEYLNSHRHSISSVMELLNSSAIPESSSNDYTRVESDDIESIDYKPIEKPRRYSHDTNCFYTLSPIEEYSEPSTEGTADCASNVQSLSVSCDPIPSDVEYLLHDKFDTFPRAKQKKNAGFQCNTMYPFEPRELDPSAFNQLHTVDSQEELQEFLLLESACVSNSHGRGLASAFDDSNN